MRERHGQAQTGGAPDRPAISVIVPLGSDRDTGDLADRLSVLALREGDEVLVADNRASPGAPLDAGLARVVAAQRERSSYYARNAGAEQARNGWLLFMDSDCAPAADLLDAYFREPPAQRCGVVAGAVVGAPSQQELLARWARSRRHLSEEHHTNVPDGAPFSAGITGNLLVRREAFESLGGFHEGIRSGGDVELCWRIQEAGWSFERRTGAVVEHHHLLRLRELAAQSARHHAGRLWLGRRYPGSVTRPKIARGLGRCAVGASFWALSANFERAAFKLVDAVSIAGAGWGWYAGDNSVAASQNAPLKRRAARSVTMLTEAFPARSETFVYNEVCGLAARGRHMRIESSVRPAHVERATARELAPSYLEDDSPREKLAGVLWLLLRHPLRAARDLRDRRRWLREEPAWPLSAIAPAARRISRSGEQRLHAHFAAGAALHAMRISRLLEIPYSVTAHAYDIFQRPQNLEEKLEGADFVVGECEFTVDHMRVLVTPGQRQRIHRIPTGADCAAFRRSRPYGGKGRVAAVGRHVEKKGFPHLIEAASFLRGQKGFDGVVIAGEGPLRSLHAELITELGVGDLVSLRGNVWGQAGVTEFLEEADVLVIPAVLAADGDRDALPVISYEALAMEVPVIASDLVGLPEVVRPPWGRLVAPGDARALADAIAEVLAMSVDERAEMGRLGREFVLENANPLDSVARLDELLSDG
jgi:colanic acid/amylovoran biosynthesis glycosyltransferase